MNKWLLATLMVLAIVVVAGLLTRKEVRAESVIEVPVEEVWEVITNPTTYGEWNPIFVAYEGTFGPGEPMALQMKMGEGEPVPVSVTVKGYVPLEWMQQSGGYPLILTYDHNWYLEPVEGGTKVTQFEYYTGFYVLFWDPTPAQLAYEQGNKNLKTRLEQ